MRFKTLSNLLLATLALNSAALRADGRNALLAHFPIQSMRVKQTIKIPEDPGVIKRSVLKHGITTSCQLQTMAPDPADVEVPAGRKLRFGDSFSRSFLRNVNSDKHREYVELEFRDEVEMAYGYALSCTRDHAHDFTITLGDLEELWGDTLSFKLRVQSQSFASADEPKLEDGVDSKTIKSSEYSSPRPESRLEGRHAGSHSAR